MDFAPACAEPHGGSFVMLSAVTQLGVTNSCSNWGFSINYCKQELIIYPDKAAVVVLMLSFIISFFLQDEDSDTDIDSSEDGEPQEDEESAVPDKGDFKVL